jgi:hypothetical protein
MVSKRVCRATTADGRHCPAPPLRDEEYCFMHSPAHAAEAAEARRLGGLRHRRESTLSIAYDLESLGTVEGIVRVLDIALRDVLGLDNSVPRNRTLIGVAAAATRLLEPGDLAARVAGLEAAVGSQERSSDDAAFPQESPDDPKAPPRRG